MHMHMSEWCTKIINILEVESASFMGDSLSVFLEIIEIAMKSDTRLNDTLLEEMITVSDDIPTQEYNRYLIALLKEQLNNKLLIPFNARTNHEIKQRAEYLIRLYAIAYLVKWETRTFDSESEVSNLLIPTVCMLSNLKTNRLECLSFRERNPSDDKDNICSMHDKIKEIIESEVRELPDNRFCDIKGGLAINFPVECERAKSINEISCAFTHAIVSQRKEPLDFFMEEKLYNVDFAVFTVKYRESGFVVFIKQQHERRTSPIESEVFPIFYDMVSGREVEYNVEAHTAMDSCIREYTKKLNVSLLLRNQFEVE